MSGEASKPIPAPTLGDGNTNLPTSHTDLPHAGDGRSYIAAAAAAIALSTILWWVAILG